MDDQDLLKYYLSLRESEAYQWNLSAKSLYLELETRDFITRHFKPSFEIKACNVGIGVGEWDDFIGYYLNVKGQLTSIDIDREICDLFKYRQQREGHDNPSQVVCDDFISCPLPQNEYDLLTIIGSTLTQIGNPTEVFNKIYEVMKPEGYLFLMNFESNLGKGEITDLLSSNGFSVDTVEEFDRYPSVKFYCLGAHKKQLIE